MIITKSKSREIDYLVCPPGNHKNTEGALAPPPMFLSQAAAVFTEGSFCLHFSTLKMDVSGYVLAVDLKDWTNSGKQQWTKETSQTVDQNVNQNLMTQRESPNMEI